jgi:hypothetical protein
MLIIIRIVTLVFLITNFIKADEAIPANIDMNNESTSNNYESEQQNAKNANSSNATTEQKQVLEHETVKDDVAKSEEDDPIISTVHQKTEAIPLFFVTLFGPIILLSPAGIGGVIGFLSLLSIATLFKKCESLSLYHQLSSIIMIITLIATTYPYRYVFSKLNSYRHFAEITVKNKKRTLQHSIKDPFDLDKIIETRNNMITELKSQTVDNDQLINTDTNFKDVYKNKLSQFREQIMTKYKQTTISQWIIAIVIIGIWNISGSKRSVNSTASGNRRDSTAAWQNP